MLRSASTYINITDLQKQPLLRKFGQRHDSQRIVAEKFIEERPKEEEDASKKHKIYLSKRQDDLKKVYLREQRFGALFSNNQNR